MAVFVDLSTAACTVSSVSGARATRRFSTLYTPDISSPKSLVNTGGSESKDGYNEAQAVLADIDQVVNTLEVK